MKKSKIKLSPAEKQSGSSRVKWAEGLIKQLPANHEGRNSWLLNYGTCDESKALRAKRNAAPKPRFEWSDKYDCMIKVE